MGALKSFLDGNSAKPGTEIIQNKSCIQLMFTSGCDWCLTVTATFVSCNLSRYWIIYGRLFCSFVKELQISTIWFHHCGKTKSMASSKYYMYVAQVNIQIERWSSCSKEEEPVFLGIIAFLNQYWGYDETVIEFVGYSLKDTYTITFHLSTSLPLWENVHSKPAKFENASCTPCCGLLFTLCWCFHTQNAQFKVVSSLKMWLLCFSDDG